MLYFTENVVAMKSWIRLYPVSYPKFNAVDYVMTKFLMMNVCRVLHIHFITLLFLLAQKMQNCTRFQGEPLQQKHKIHGGGKTLQFST